MTSDVDETTISINYELPPKIGRLKYWFFCLWHEKTINQYGEDVKHQGFRIFGFRVDLWIIIHD